MFYSFFSFILCSDIDLVICGKWPTLPFGDLSEALQHVAKPGSLKVLERAAVSLVRCIEIVLSFSIRLLWTLLPNMARQTKSFFVTLLPNVP